MNCAHCQERQAVIYWGRFALCRRCYDPLHLAAFDGLLTPESVYWLSLEREIYDRWDEAFWQLDMSRISWSSKWMRLAALGKA